MSANIPHGLFGQPPTEPDPAARLEGRLGRVARAKGLKLLKATRRDPSSPLYGTYMLVGPNSEIVHHGSDTDTYGLSLQDVAKCLGEDVVE